jgi:hypothetical protein
MTRTNALVKTVCSSETTTGKSVEISIVYRAEPAIAVNTDPLSRIARSAIQERSLSSIRTACPVATARSMA